MSVETENGLPENAEELHDLGLAVRDCGECDCQGCSEGLESFAYIGLSRLILAYRVNSLARCGYQSTTLFQAFYEDWDEDKIRQAILGVKLSEKEENFLPVLTEKLIQAGAK